ncbi:MAG: Crp/Fnr family transcriptional regulator [Cyanobacteria bacterium P01_A01_bin.105]
MSYFLKPMRSSDRPYTGDRPYTCTLKRRDALPKASLWKIQSGFVRVVTWNDNGDVMPLGFWGGGSLVGGALVTSEPCEIQALTTVVAERLSRLVTVPDDAFVAHSRQMADLIQILHCRQVEERLLQVLCWLGLQLGQPVAGGVCLPFPITHQELADAIATTRVTVTRCLSQLETEGYLKWSRAEKVLFYDTLNHQASFRPAAQAS